MYRTLALSLPALALFGCKEDATPNADADLQSLQEQVAALSDAVDALELENNQLHGDVAVLTAVVEANGSFDASSILDSIDDLEDDLADLQDAGFVSSDALTSYGFATRAWVDDQVFASQGWVTSQSYVSATSLEAKGYATEAWVDGKGYALANDLTSLTSRVAVNETSISANSNEIGVNSTQIASNSSTMASNSSDIDANASSIGSLQTDVSDLDADLEDVLELFDYVTVDTSSDAIYFDAVNVYITSGGGNTNGSVNGLGNLIIGYGEWDSTTDVSGSHNLVMGVDNGFSGYSGLVNGYENDISGDYATVLSGSGNEATGQYAVVVTGRNNAADGSYGGILTGQFGDASGAYAAVVSGYAGTSSATYATVITGSSNTADDTGAAATGQAQKTDGQYDFDFKAVL